MKIGILTYHYNDNIGAALQCHGLWRTLSEMGHDVEIIDYRPHHVYLMLGKKWIPFSRRSGESLLG